MQPPSRINTASHDYVHDSYSYDLCHLVGYIKRTDGLCGCFVGIGPKLAGMIIGSFGSERIAKRLGYGEIVDTRQTETLTDSELYVLWGGSDQSRYRD